MIEKFAGAHGMLASELLDLNHTSISMILVSLFVSKIATKRATQVSQTSEPGH